MTGLEAFVLRTLVMGHPVCTVGQTLCGLVAWCNFNFEGILSFLKT